MNEPKVDISAIVTVHQEGRLAHRTMRSVFQSAVYARERGMSVEIIVVMDSPDQATKGYFTGYGQEDICVREVEFHDPGLTRNYGVSIASGVYIALIDGDNLIAGNWLYRAFEFLEATDRLTIAHPEYHIFFEARNMVWRQLSSTDFAFRVWDLFEANHWDTAAAARKDIFLRYPFESTGRDSGFGFEDWHFNCQTLADGIQHEVVPNTVHFIRAKETGSRSEFDNRSNRVIRPTKLFDPDILVPILDEYESRPESVIGHEERSGTTIWRKRKILHGLYQSCYDRQHLGYRAVASLLRPLVRMWPRLLKLIQAARDAAWTDVRSTDVLPAWLIEEWRAIHAIEPQTCPEKWRILNLQVYEPPSSRTWQQYIDLCHSYGKNVSHVFLVPWLKRGGSDLETINYIEAIVRYQLGRDVVVIATENVDSPWARRLPEKVRFIEFGKIVSQISREEQEKLLVRLVIQMAPQVVHNLNSDLGYRVFVKFGSALRTISNLYVTTFCKDLTSEGYGGGYAFSYLPECFQSLRAIACDNRTFLDDLERTYAFGNEKMYVHYQPIGDAQKTRSTREQSVKSRLDILWAGRLDRQKRPDILEKIATSCKELPFVFHIYGAPVLDTEYDPRGLRMLSNARFYGSYDGFQALEAWKFDIFLYTSEWDGLPNVLLEAMSVGLPVIAPAVGGVGELVINGKTGYLIDPYDDVGAYVECLRKVHVARSQIPTIVENAQELLRTRHRWETFVEELRRFPGYVAQQ